jgi:hypothetical protein
MSLMASVSSFISYPAIALTLGMVCLILTPFYDCLVLQKPNNTWDMNIFKSDSKTDLKLWCKYCIKFQLLYSRVPKTFVVDWRLFVSYYYPTTHTDYPSTTRGMSLGPPEAVNIVYMDIPDIWALFLSEIYGVQYATDMWGQKFLFVS